MCDCGKDLDGGALRTFLDEQQCPLTADNGIFIRIEEVSDDSCMCRGGSVHTHITSAKLKVL